MKPVSFWNLEPGREYFIQSNHHFELYKHKLIFSSLHGPSHFHDFGSSESAWFLHRGFHIEFERDDIFYDAEIIREKSQLAKQSMEQRALDMILKRVVNEHFEW